MQHEQKPLKDTLAPLLRVLRDLGGKFSFMDDDGNQFILASKEALEADKAPDQEQQLALPQAQSVARAIRKHVDSSIEDDVLERINRDIALAASAEQEEDTELDAEEMDDVDDLAETDEEAPSEDDLGDSYVFPPSPSVPKPPTIRFEPLKGDLHPDLQ